MIYKNSYFRKEFRQAYADYRISINRMFTYGVFLGLLTFSVHFLLQTVYESVLTQSIPEMMLPSYFSVAFTYNIVSYVFFLLYFLYYYNYLSFSEIRDNSWYLLVKMYYSPVKMIFTKLSVRLISVAVTFSVGFLTAMLLTSFLKYPFIPDYFLPLFLSGLFDIMIVVLITMALSLYFKAYDSARIVIISAAVIIYLLKISTGYYKVVSNRGLMRDIRNLFDVHLSVYQVIFGSFCLICIFVCFFRAHNIAKYYSVDEVNTEGLAVQNYKTHKIKILAKKSESKLSRFVSIVVNGLLIIVILALILLNGAILMISALSPEKEADFMGYIPYVFQSSTMEPYIDKNDLIYIQRIDADIPVDVGDIVIYKVNKDVYIEQIMAVQDGTYTVDVSYYPPTSEKDALKMEVLREDMYGIYAGKFRWVGALVLFANTIFGRLIFLMAPAILLFFYKPIVSFFTASGKKTKEKKQISKELGR
jgi:hypothetical protein